VFAWVDENDTPCYIHYPRCETPLISIRHESTEEVYRKTSLRQHIFQIYNEFPIAPYLNSSYSGRCASFLEKVKEFMGKGIFDRNWALLIQVRFIYLLSEGGGLMMVG